MHTFWLEQLSDRFNRWIGRETQASGGVAIYVSGSAVACAGLLDDPQQEGLKVALRADPIKKLADVPETLAAQIKALSQQHALHTAGCNLVLAPELYNLSLVERPDVADDELLDAVRWTIQDQVEYPVEHAVLDVFDLPGSASRERPMVYVVSIEAEFLRTLTQKVTSVGLEVGSVDIAELALRNLVWRCFPDADQSVAMLRLTANSGLISISRGDELYLARRISGMPKRFAEDAWADFRERLVLQVQRSIDYYESAMNQPHCNVLIAACTHGWSNRVCEFLSENMAIPIRSLADLVQEEVRLTLHNPEAEEVDWSQLNENQANAIAAGLPAIGGVLRQQIGSAHAHAISNIAETEAA